MASFLHLPPSLHRPTPTTTTITSHPPYPPRRAPFCHLHPRPNITPLATRPPQGVGVSLSTCWLTSLSSLALALSRADKAFAVPNLAEVSVGIAALNPEVLFALLAVEGIALVGAAVGGILARQRKQELERLNTQLRKINEYLRNKASIESYAPGLVYAPVGRPSEKDDLMALLKAGKKFLREKNPERAYEEFKKALALAQLLKDATEEKKAARGLGASCQRNGKYREAIDYHILVLKISKRTGERSGDTEALGSIADCYCELGDFETAQKFYNQYIDRLNVDDTEE